MARWATRGFADVYLNICRLPASTLLPNHSLSGQFFIIDPKSIKSNRIRIYRFDSVILKLRVFVCSLLPASLLPVFAEKRSKGRILKLFFEEREVQLDTFIIMEEDLISPLVDDILILIISHLSLKEAITTSVLSHRWRGLWRFTSRLDFDITKIKNNLKPKMPLPSLNYSYGFFYGLAEYHSEARRLSLISRSRLIDSINGVLQSHQAVMLDEFTLSFDRDCKDHIDSWLTYALERRVKKLHLNFQSMNCRYTFSPHFLHNNKLDSITVIRFNQVSVADDVVDLILRLCPFLEVLSLRSSATLSHLKVFGPLKHLEILFCRNVKSVEISAKDLVSFKYYGPCAYIIVNDAPRLVEASIGDNSFLMFLLLSSKLGGTIRQFKKAIPFIMNNGTM
uniref:F-box domain-containing protein n=1 Tax=Manihot esculenta TaxID=3983 RepID=A0A2C9V0N1_MANES